MQVIFEDKDERSPTGGTNPVDFVICIRRVSKCLEGQHVGRFGRRNIGI